jgi:hypothetical protein
MKNYWLIMGGASLGLGLSSLMNISNTKIDDISEYQKKQKQNAAWFLIGGALVVIGGIKLFDK